MEKEMNPISAINFLTRLSEKMTGLSVAECRIFDMALAVLTKHLTPPAGSDKKLTLVDPACEGKELT